MTIVGDGVLVEEHAACGCTFNRGDDGHSIGLSARGVCSSMVDLGTGCAGLEGGGSWEALRDELLGRPVVDVDGLPRAGARGTFARAGGGARSRSSERHGAWRIALEDGSTVDFAAAGSIEDDTKADYARAMAAARGARARRSLRRPG